MSWNSSFTKLQNGTVQIVWWLTEKHKTEVDKKRRYNWPMSRRTVETVISEMRFGWLVGWVTQPSISGHSSWLQTNTTIRALVFRFFVNHPVDSLQIPLNIYDCNIYDYNICDCNICDCTRRPHKPPFVNRGKGHRTGWLLCCPRWLLGCARRMVVLGVIWVNVW